MRNTIFRIGFLALIIMALAASAVWTWDSFRQETAVQQVQEATVEVTPDYHITVTKGTSLWRQGTVLPQGAAAYFYATAPEVVVTPVVKASGTDWGNISGTIRTRAYLQSVNDQSGVYWSQDAGEVPEQNFTLSESGPGETDRSEYTAKAIRIDVAPAFERAKQISEEVGFQSGVLRLTILSEVSLSATLGGQRVEKAVTQELPLTLDQMGFSVPKTEDTVVLASFGQPEDQSSTQPLLAKIVNHWQPAVSDLALLLLLAIVLMMRTHTSPNALLEHRRFREWITEGSVQAANQASVYIHTLEGLVDLAIDLDKRVIYDSRIKRYFVLEGEILYQYDPEESGMHREKRQQLGRLLMDRGLLRAEQLETGLVYQRRTGGKLGDILTALGFIDESALYSTLAAQQGFNYYEADPEEVIRETEWLEKMSIQTARALQAVPLGTRTDGRLMIACSEPSKEGIRKALQEMFGPELIIVAACPSAIAEALDMVEYRGVDRIAKGTAEGWQDALYGKLDKEERAQFAKVYAHGRLDQRLLLKSAGIAGASDFAQHPETELLTSWLVRKGRISGDLANLLQALDRTVRTMPWKYRQDLQLPELLDLLQKADYLTADSIDWIRRELPQDAALGRLMVENHLVSEKTIRNANILLDAVRNILMHEEALPGSVADITY